MSMMRTIRAWSGKKLEEFLWRYLQPRVRTLVEKQDSALQKTLHEEIIRSEAQVKKDLELQMNFQPALPADWQSRVKQGGTYVDFENIFRDTKIIAKRNARYIPFFADVSRVLDIGCGRGEFLEMLRREGIEAFGIDNSPEMIEVCQQKGLTNVKVADAIEYVSSVPGETLGGIFSCHAIEHLPIEEVMKFFPLARNALTLGGTLIVETPNPHSLPAFKLFWLDPTHVRPLFPEFLEWCARAGGFTNVEILYLTDDGFSSTHSPWYGNYALVAKK